MDYVVYATEISFPKVKEAESLSSRVSVWLLSGESSLCGLQKATASLCHHMAEGDSKLSEVSSYEGTNPFLRAPPS